MSGQVSCPGLPSALRPARTLRPAMGKGLASTLRLAMGKGLANALR